MVEKKISVGSITVTSMACCSTIPAQVVIGTSLKIRLRQGRPRRYEFRGRHSYRPRRRRSRRSRRQQRSYLHLPHHRRQHRCRWPPQHPVRPPRRRRPRNHLRHHQLHRRP
jgi:hypothetical protein